MMMTVSGPLVLTEKGSRALAREYPSTSQRVAVDASDGMVYASDKKADDVAAFEDIALPSVGIVPPSERTTRA